MKRPKQHEIDSAGQRLVREALEPLGWVVRAVEPDYGIDFEIEVFARRTPDEPLESTGVVFKAQLKSSASSDYSAEGDFVSEVIAVQNLRYLVHEINVPTILLHADAERKRVFWHALQLDARLAGSLASLPDARGTLTLRIPTVNALPNTVAGLVDALREAAVVLAARALASVSEMQFYSAFSGRDNAALLRAMHARTDLLSLAEADRLRLNDDAAGARNLLDRVFHDPHASVETKFAAELINEPIESQMRIRSGATDQERASVELESALRLCAIARNGPKHLRLYALIRRATAEFGALLYEDWGLFLNWRVHESAGDGVWSTPVLIDRAVLAGRLARKYRQCVRLANVGLRSEHRWALADAVGRLSHAVMKFAIQSRAQGYDQAAADLERHAFDICRVAGSCALEAADENQITSAAMNGLLLSSGPESESQLWALEIMQAVKDPDLKRRFTDYVERVGRRRMGEEFPDDIKSTEAQIYEIMAAALGVDLTDEKNPVTRIVRIGIKDLNPERVLRHCEHLSVRIASAGILAGVLRLPTAGSKLLRCERHGYALGTLALDDGFPVFREQFCEKCQDLSPRPASWVWSPEPPRGNVD